MHLAKYLSLLRNSERLLAEAFAMISDRHGKHGELRDSCRLFASWAAESAEALEPFAKRYGRRLATEPERLRAALFHDPRSGGLGMLRDVQDLGVLIHDVLQRQTGAIQAARALRDLPLEECLAACQEKTQRQLAWVRTHLQRSAAQALTVPAKKSLVLASSIPHVLSPAALPDLAWAPVAVALLAGALGLLGLAAGQPWLLPSLGPSIFLLAADAAHPSARASAVLVGHLTALAAGALSVAAFDAWAEPVVLATGAATWPRVGAAVLALVLTVALGLLTRSSHPPAAATALLVALGSIGDLRTAMGLAVGAALLAVMGALFRQLRLGRVRRTMSPHLPPRVAPRAPAPGTGQLAREI